MKPNSTARRPGLRFFRLLTFGILALLLGTTNSVRADPGPDLIIDIVNSGGFVEGGTGTYTITVTNQGTTDTTGMVTVNIIIYDPTALTPQSLSGTGWSCTLATLECTRSDALGSTQSYSAITLTVDVADDTADTALTEAGVAGGGEPSGNQSNNIDTDNTTITQLPDLIVIKSHVEDSIVIDDGINPPVYYDFAEGAQDRIYTIKVKNNGGGPTSGTVTVTDTLPTGLTNGTLSGDGWNCAGLTCTRSDVLASGAFYPDLTLTVDIEVDAPELLTNSVSVSGGGEIITTNNTDTDPTTIQPKPDLVITGYQLVDTTPSRNPLPGNPDANEPFAIKVFVENRGGAEMPPFYRSVYFENHFLGLQISPEGCLYSTDPNDADLGDFYPSNLFGGIPPRSADGGLVSVDIPSGLPAGTHKLYLYADPSCLGDVESIETNNSFGPITVTVAPGSASVTKSIASQDGWVLESGENTNMGKTMNKGSSLLYVGDDAANRQYISILSFDTSGIPDNAVITSVVLKFKYSGFVGTLPFNTHGQLQVDVRRGAFSRKAALQPADFKSAASKKNVLTYSKNKPGNWYTRSFTPDEFVYVNKLGLTQFRLRFTKDDNNDFGADYLKIFSGSAAAGVRPKLIIQYYVP
ncbi:MAG: hypothetical protein DPW18_11045 [Chloroflexi bacterium]|nr:hypothetical protein [Chloroflexota bacterium]MDL1944195.1 hypothetical protein [Chloroflexi bacterium CFX2]